MFASLLAYMGMYNQSIQIFYFLLDVALGMHNFTIAMELYSDIGKIYQYSGKYEMALIAYRKMLQFAWINKAQGYELLAYQGMAKQYYYMQQLEKAKFYLDR